MTYIVAIDHQDGSEAGYLAINDGAGFTRNEHMERAYRTTKDDAEELAADYNDYYQMKGYNLRAKAVRYVEPKQVGTVELVPSWKAAAQIYVMAIQNGTPQGERAGIEGIMDMAAKLDALNAKRQEETQPEPKVDGYQIFDSMDAERSSVEKREELLFPLLDELTEEAAEEGRPITFAIAKLFDNGDRTYDF